MFKIKSTSTTNIAIIGIVILQGLAIWKGIDGAMLLAAIAVIAGLGGYEVGIRRKPK